MTENCERHCLNVYMAIYRFMRDNDYAPTHKEIAELAGIRRGQAMYYLRMLKAENLITRPRKHQNRSIRLTGVKSVRARP